MNARTAVLALALATGLVAAVRADDAPRSGPDTGSKVSAFDVQDVTGPNKGKTLCYV